MRRFQYYFVVCFNGIIISLEQQSRFNSQNLQAKIEEIERQIERDKQEAARIIRVPIKRTWGGVPIIDVKFNDSVNSEMLLDTGAAMVSITTKIARLLNVVPTGTRRF